MQTNLNLQRKKNTEKAFLSVLFSFILLTSLYMAMLRHQLDDDKERYGYIARNQTEHITMTVDCVMSRTNTLKTMVKENHGNTSWFDTVAEDIYVTVVVRAYAKSTLSATCSSSQSGCVSMVSPTALPA